MPALNNSDKTYYCLLIFLAFLASALHAAFWLIPPTALLREDIYYIWLEGKRIATGENPYARVLAGDMRVNDKYATYFPTAYLLCALVQKLGFKEFHNWIYFWRPISLVFHTGIVALTLKYFRDRGLLILGLAASITILLGRWSLYIIQVQQLEFAAIFFLLVSLCMLKQRPKLSLLFFSISLGIKHIAIFTLPLYLIHLWISECKSKRINNTIIGFAIIISIPLVTSIPFLYWNAEGFFKSILFSATRFGDIHINAPSLDVVVSKKFNWFVGLTAKLPMLFTMGIVYLSFFKEKTQVFSCCTMIMMVFAYFNSVLYLQYFIWYICLIPFALVELKPLLSPLESSSKN